MGKQVVHILPLGLAHIVTQEAEHIPLLQEHSMDVIGENLVQVHNMLVLSLKYVAIQMVLLGLS